MPAPMERHPAPTYRVKVVYAALFRFPVVVHVQLEGVFAG